MAFHGLENEKRMAFEGEISNATLEFAKLLSKIITNKKEKYLLDKKAYEYAFLVEKNKMVRPHEIMRFEHSKRMIKLEFDHEDDINNTLFLQYCQNLGFNHKVHTERCKAHEVVEVEEMPIGFVASDKDMWDECMQKTSGDIAYTLYLLKTSKKYKFPKFDLDEYVEIWSNVYKEI